MPVIAITREMGSLGKDVAAGVGQALGLPLVYHEVIEPAADRRRVRKSHVIRLLDRTTSLLESLTADKTSQAIYSADEIFGLAQTGQGAVIRGWGATHLLRDVPHALRVRVCAPFDVRRQRMQERLDSDDVARIEDEIRNNDEAHAAIMRRLFKLQWTDPEHYDVVFNTERVDVAACVDEVLRLVRSPQFAETESSRARLEDLALAARVRVALRSAAETRDYLLEISASDGHVTLVHRLGNDAMLAAVEVVADVPGVRDVSCRSGLH